MRASPSPHRKEPYWKAFSTQMRNAFRRGIDWNITYPQWIKIWTASGKITERGRHVSQYVMARHGDKGPYAIGNVSIVSVEKNDSDIAKGKKLSKARRAEIREAVTSMWANLTASERAARGRIVSAAQLASGANKRAWENAEMRAKHRRGLRRAWAQRTPEERAAIGARISKAKKGKGPGRNICTIHGCEKYVHGQGLCGMHYRQRSSKKWQHHMST